MMEIIRQSILKGILYFLPLLYFKARVLINPGMSLGLVDGNCRVDKPKLARNSREL